MLLMTMPAQWLPSCAAWQLIINTPPWFFALTDIHNPSLGVRGALTTKLMCGALKVGNSRVTLLPAACAVGVIARVRPFLLHRSSNGLQLLGVRALAVVACEGRSNASAGPLRWKCRDATFITFNNHVCF